MKASDEIYKGSIPSDTAFDLFKNERDMIVQSNNLPSVIAAMDWAILEIEQLRRICKEL
jgi:hypothetical protein